VYLYNHLFIFFCSLCISEDAVMQSLLRWGIENSSNDNNGSATDGTAPRRTDLDPGIIDAILGRPDAELMKEALAKAQDVSFDEDARLTALDDLEMVQ
jgi:hsp70-interacting protein